MTRQKFSRELKIEAVRLVTDRGTFGGKGVKPAVPEIERMDRAALIAAWSDLFGRCCQTNANLSPLPQPRPDVRPREGRATR